MVMLLGRRTLLTGAASAALVAACAPTRGQACASDAKLIQLGLDCPEVVDMTPEVIAGMERAAPWFDGIVLDLWSNQGVTGRRQGTQYHMAWTSFGYSRPLTYHADSDMFGFSRSYQALMQAAPLFRRFGHNFLKLTTMYGTLDLFDPAYDAVCLPNMQKVAQIAKDAGCVGIFFDTEEYNARPLAYYWQKARTPSTRTFHDYQARARYLGAQTMLAWQSAFPSLEVLLTFGYWKPWKHVSAQHPLPAVGYSLLPAFLDGMLDVATQPIHDGYEDSYPFTRASQFDAVLGQFATATWSASPHYGTLYQPGFGLWLDYPRRWSNTEFATNYFSPAQWTASLKLALAKTPKYVWFYNEIPHLYNGTFPQAYHDATTAGRAV